MQEQDKSLKRALEGSIAAKIETVELSTDAFAGYFAPCNDETLSSSGNQGLVSLSVYMVLLKRGIDP